MTWAIMMPTSGRTMREPICCAPCGSFTREEIIIPNETANNVNNGVSTEMANSQVGLRIRLWYISGVTMKRDANKKMAKLYQVAAIPGIAAAIALATSTSHVR